MNDRYAPTVRSVPVERCIGGTELTADEYYLLILSTDAGGQFYSRENAPSGTY